MVSRKRFAAIAVLLVVVFALTACAPVTLDLNRLSDKDVKRAQDLLVKLAPLIKERQDRGNISTLTFDELYAPLDAQDRAFLEAFKKLNARELNVRIPFRGIATGKEELVVIKGQMVKVQGEAKELPPQFLPPDVFNAYTAMMAQMRKDLGRRLYVESGYRSSAYQLYLLVFYLSNHAYSLRETVKFVALPGYSEHGSPAHQALDFINENGINGEDNPKEFEDLPENAWLLKNAARFGFVLSYPKNSRDGITYEPWHWRFDRK
jgi:LAS superfamily LD-carboxypeptidase LdcB